jgi:hypothetical protein
MDVAVRNHREDRLRVLRDPLARLFLCGLPVGIVLFGEAHGTHPGVGEEAAAGRAFLRAQGPRIVRFDLLEIRAGECSGEFVLELLSVLDLGGKGVQRPPQENTRNPETQLHLKVRVLLTQHAAKTASTRARMESPYAAIVCILSRPS